jgi:hypothetical protein
MFDALREGSSNRAKYVNNFGTAERLREAIAEYEQRNKNRRANYNKTRHTLYLMYHIDENRRSIENKKRKTDSAELEWVKDVMRKDKLHLKYLERSAKNRGENRGKRHH